MDKKILELLLDLVSDVRGIKKVMVTKDDLKKALSNYPTRDELKAVLVKQREDISEDFGEIINELMTQTDKIKADRSTVEALEERVEKIEQKIAN